MLESCPLLEALEIGDLVILSPGQGFSVQALSLRKAMAESRIASLSVGRAVLPCGHIEGGCAQLRWLLGRAAPGRIAVGLVAIGLGGGMLTERSGCHLAALLEEQKDVGGLHIDGHLDWPPSHDDGPDWAAIWAGLAYHPNRSLMLDASCFDTKRPPGWLDGLPACVRSGGLRALVCGEAVPDSDFALRLCDELRTPNVCDGAGLPRLQARSLGSGLSRYLTRIVAHTSFASTRQALAWHAPDDDDVAGALRALLAGAPSLTRLTLFADGMLSRVSAALLGRACARLTARSPPHLRLLLVSPPSPLTLHAGPVPLRGLPPA